MPGFWRAVTQFDRSKILTWIALRNSLAVTIPLLVGIALGRPAAGSIAAIGALNVAYSDGSDPYLYRARRMLAASILVALAVFVGAIAAGHVAFSVALTAAFGFAAGIMVAVNETSFNIGNITLVTLIVFSAHGMAPRDALQAGAVAFAGGLLQTAFAIASWPITGRAPERRVLAALYAELARAAASPSPATSAPAASDQSTEAQRQLAVLSGNPSIEAERYLSLLSQAERMRLALLALSRALVRIGREDGGAAWTPPIARSLEIASHLLAAIAQSLSAAQPGSPHSDALDELGRLAAVLRDEVRGAPTADLRALLNDGSRQLEALAGQLRSAVELAAHLSTGGAAAFSRREAAQRWDLRLTGAFAVLRANLTRNSAAFRHALRLSACVAVGEALAHAINWQRSYWIPMTIAIVLRPDFTGTFSRGALRLLGTFIGLAVATAIFYFLQPSAVLQVILLFLATLMMRSLGPANYGIFVTALSALIVLLLALTGVAPGEVVAARGINTFAGGLIALIAYALWPTWERTQFGETLARLFDAYRVYFDAVRDGYLGSRSAGDPALDRARLEARLARSNFEASAARFRAEPRVSAGRFTTLDGILANSHRFIHAVMSLEAGLATTGSAPPRAAFREFSADLDTTLDRLAASLRGSPLRPADLPDLRDDHRRLLSSAPSRTQRYDLVNLETDRITNSLNTLAAEVEEWTRQS